MKKSLSLVLLTMLGLTILIPSQGEAFLSYFMKKNFETVLKLQTYIHDPKQFEDPKNKEAILELINDLADTSKHLSKTVSLEKMPEANGIAVIYDSYLKDIAQGFQKGNTDYVRHQLKTATHFCMTCHTNMNAKKSWVDMTSSFEKLNLEPLYQAEFYAGTRQFNKAMINYKKITSSPIENEDDIRKLILALKGGLNISVRSQDDPKTARDLLDSVKSKEKLPYFVKRNLEEWNKDITNWESEKAALSKKAKATELMDEAKRLIKKAQDQETVVAAHGGHISWLRATALIQKALRLTKNGHDKARAYYFLGVAYHSLDDPLLWDLDEYYFQACVKEHPHSDIAKQCFNRIATKAYFGYSGSQGTVIPPEVRKRLQDYRKLAE